LSNPDISNSLNAVYEIGVTENVHSNGSYLKFLLLPLIRILEVIFVHFERYFIYHLLLIWSNFHYFIFYFRKLYF